MMIRKLALLLVFANWMLFCYGQVAKVIHIDVPGELCKSLTPTEKATITNLTISGIIDARDFKCMRDELPKLMAIDMTTVSVAAFQGSEGTHSSTSYLANEIPQYAFFNRSTYEGKSSLKKIFLPASITAIGEFSFNRCANLELANLPVAVVEIKDYAFNSCAKLTNINIPASVELITKYSFSGCSSLTSFNVDPQNKAFSDYQGVLFNKDQSILIKHPEGKKGEFIIPNTVNTIANYAFSQATGLTSIVIPSSVRNIETQAFYNCTSLTTIHANATTPIALKASTSVFFNVNKDACILHVPSGTAELYRESPQWSDFNSILDNKATQVAAGGLSKALAAEDMSTITKLTLSGTIDARDFKTMRDAMPELAIIDLSGVSITAYDGSNGTLATSHSYPANAIPPDAFCNGMNGKISLTAVSLPNSVTVIGRRAFTNCTACTSIKLPTALRSIEEEALSGCKSLTSISIPLATSYIGKNVFDGCIGITAFNVDAENGLYSSENGVLYDKYKTVLIKYPQAKQGSFEVPAGVLKLDTHSLNGCTNLVSITIAKSVENIEKNAISACPSLVDITVKSDNVNFISKDGVLFSLNPYALIKFPESKIGNYNIPEQVISIEENAFYGCESLLSVSIPKSVTSIGSQAFYNCHELALIVANPNPPISLRATQNVFYNVNKNTCAIQVPAGSIETYKKTYQWQDFTNFVDGLTVNVPTAGTLKAQLKAEEMAELTKLTVIGKIDARDFKTIRDELPKLSILDISETSIKAYSGDGGTYFGNASYSAYEIPQFAFFDGNAGKACIKTILLPDSTVSIGANAFTQCTGLLKFTIGSRIAHIKSQAFDGCNNLTDFSIKNGNQNYHVKDGVLFSKNSRTLILYPQGKAGNYTIPDSVNTVAEFAFAGASKLTNIKFSKNLRNIGERAFANCIKLSTVSIPKTLTSIGNFAFEKCKKLTKITVENDNPFYSSSDGVLLNKNKTNLIQFPAGKDGSYQIPDSVTTISELAFADCSELTAISIPKSVKTIGNQAFVNCKNLNSIYIGTPQPILFGANSNIFHNVNKKNCMLNVPTGCTAAYKTSPTWQDFANINDLRKISIKAGGLQTACTPEEQANISKLTISGTMDARDFKTLRDLMPRLESVDLSDVKIISYDGGQGTAPGHANYPSNTIPAYTFYNSNTPNKTLLSITLPNTASGIGNSAFSHCSHLTYINLPKSITTIGANAFAECEDLHALTIPKNIANIGNQAFTKCKNLLQLTVDEDNTHFAYKDGVLFNKNYTTIVAYISIPTGNYSVPDGISKIEEYAFADCDQLTGITLPKSVNYIGSHAFQNCAKLAEIILHNANPPGLGSDVFISTDKGAISLQVPIGADRNFKNANQWKEFTHLSDEKKITIKAGELRNAMTVYELQAVSKLVITGTIDARDLKLIRDNMPNIMTLDLGNTSIVAYSGDSGTVHGKQFYPASTIPHNAFYNGHEGKATLYNVILPTTTEEIGEFAFAMCTNLQKVNLPETLTIIGNAAFFNCTKLNNIFLPHSLSKIGDNAFKRCVNITKITLPNHTTTIGNKAFSDCVNLNELHLGSELKTIKFQAFYGCHSIDSIHISSLVENIEEQAFTNCNHLTQITVDQNNSHYTSIDGILYNKAKTVLITYPTAKNYELIIPRGVTEISDFAFFLAANLSKVTIPNSVTRIGHCAFLGCKSLNSISIPSSVKFIGMQAFSKCRALTTIYAYPSTPIHFGLTDNIFTGINKTNCKLYVASGAVEAYKSASLWKDFINVADGRIINIVAGTLASTLSDEEMNTLAKLTITGTMDARDFRCLRDSMPKLGEINLSGISIKAYNGEGGTFASDASYPVNEIPQFAFDNGITGKSNLKNIILPASATSIGNNAFSGSSLSTITITPNINLIRSNAFINCNQLLSIIVDPKNNNFSSLDGVLFNKNQSNIILYPAAKTGSYTIPEKVITFEKNAFSGCKELSSLSIPSTMMAIKNGAFEGCSKLTHYTVHPDNPKFAAQDGVLFNKSITALIDFPKAKMGTYSIPTTIIAIMNNAFASCVGLTSITIPYTVNNIGTNVFKSCVLLNEINVDKDNSNFASQNGVLYNKEMTTLLECPKAKTGELTIADSVQIIGDNAFSECIKLTGLTLSKSLKTIGNEAFSGCVGLKNITVQNSIPPCVSIKSSIIPRSVKKTCKLHLPSGSKEAYNNANLWKDFENVVEK